MTEPSAPSPAVPDPSELSEPVRIDAGGWGFTWVGDGQGVLRQVGLGPSGHSATVDVDPRFYPSAFPTWGDEDPFRPSALRVTHADGATTTRLVVADASRSGETGEEHIVVHLSDELQALDVELHVRTHSSGVLEQWVEITHDEPGPITLFDYDSLFPFLLIDQAAELVQFGGAGWADEWRWTTQQLHPGTTSLASFGGLQPHLQRNPVILLSPDGPSTEDDGAVIAMSVAWGGNTRIDLDVRPAPDAEQPRTLRLRAGANPVGAEYTLDPGERFVTPTVAWTWSDDGRRTTTRRFHEWTRSRVLRAPERLRPLVVNNWEATFFDFDEDRLRGLIEAAADLGGDVFLLDDGWFGTAHPRDDDTTSLGDWDHDPTKLPHGLAGVADIAAENDIRFGIWVEPEMVNPVSELHERHPEWVLRDEREPRLHRNQLALDVLHSEVREFAAGVVDRTIASAPSTSYVKWDANRPITDPSSATLSADRRSNLWVDHVRATWELMSTVAERHPDIELMLCASGGGRTDHGTLRYFHEFWTSDNTDPVTRVRMQWACGHFFPASTMAAHVTRWGERPMPFAAAVALSARFGIDLDLATVSGDERDVLREAVEIARRTQDLVQQGELVRLLSPVEPAPGPGAGPDALPSDGAALAYLSPDRHRAVVFAYRLDGPAGVGSSVRHLPLHGVGTDDYDVRSTDLDGTTTHDVIGGESLRSTGLEWSPAGPCSARIWELTRR